MNVVQKNNTVDHWSYRLHKFWGYDNGQHIKNLINLFFK